MSEVRLTPEGVAKYEQQLEYLKTTRRMEIAELIKVARSFGDLSENAEYDAAKAEQAKNEYDIVQLENLLRTAIVIDDAALDVNVVNVGMRVTVVMDGSDAELTYDIVGSAEADPFQGKISNESPIGRALLDRSVGDHVDAHTPAGLVGMKIVNIVKA